MAKCTKEEAQETRSRILDAAEDLFHAQGVSRTSLEDIAQAAAVTRGAIYWHFKNKSDLFVGMCERVRLPMEAMVEAAAEEHRDDPLGLLRKKCVFVLREAMHNPHCHKVYAILYHKCEFVDAADPILVRQQECFQRGRANIERFLAQAVEKVQLPQDLDVPLAAAVFHAAVSGLMNNWLFSPAGFDLAGMAENVIDANLDTLRHSRALRKSGPISSHLQDMR